MLTSKLVRVRYARERIVPCYLDVSDTAWQEVAERLLATFRGQEGRTRGALEQEVRETFGSDPAQLVHQGLAKLLDDRCEYEVVSGHPPEQLREAVFAAAAKKQLASCQLLTTPFDRDAVLQEVAAGLAMTPEAVDHGLFADLKSEQRLVRFKDISAEHLLQRYNVALAQAVLLRSTRVHVHIRGEPPQRYRQLLRLVKFHRLVCEMENSGEGAYSLHLDGPLSLFTATQKYGLQLALFLPAVLRCRDYEVNAELRWGAQRKPKTFTLSPSDGLVSHYPDSGMYVPPELAMFVELFRKKIADWDIVEETNVFPLGDGFWVPDFRLTQRGTGRTLFLEVLGFWRRSSVEKHLERLRQHADQPFLLAVSEQLHVDEASLEGLPAGIHRFRQMPLPDEVARLATEMLAKN
jgi:predicted nuclease of restriction endonuclease-like RecB superfamily